MYADIDEELERVFQSQKDVLESLKQVVESNKNFFKEIYSALTTFKNQGSYTVDLLFTTNDPDTILNFYYILFRLLRQYPKNSDDSKMILKFARSITDNMNYIWEKLKSQSDTQIQIVIQQFGIVLMILRLDGWDKKLYDQIESIYLQNFNNIKSSEFWNLYEQYFNYFRKLYEIRFDFTKLTDSDFDQFFNKLFITQYIFNTEKSNRKNDFMKVIISDEKNKKFPYKAHISSDFSLLLLKYLIMMKEITMDKIIENYMNDCSDVVDFPDFDNGTYLTQFANILNDTKLFNERYEFTINDFRQRFTRYDQISQALLISGALCKDKVPEIKIIKIDESKSKEHFESNLSADLNYVMDSVIKAYKTSSKNFKILCNASLFQVPIVAEYSDFFSFDTKHAIFKRAFINHDTNNSAIVNVHRDKLFEDGLKIIRLCGPGSTVWKLKFIGENGIGTGLTREFIQKFFDELARKEEFLSKYEKIRAPPVAKQEYYYEFGVFVAKAILMSITFDACSLSDEFFAIILGREISWKDIDPAYEGFVSDPKSCSGSFNFADIGEKDCKVTEDNCQEFARKLGDIKYLFRHAHEEFTRGFSTVINFEGTKMFSASEFRKLVCGEPKRPTKQELNSIKCDKPEFEVMKSWLVDIIVDFNDEDFKDFLKFLTGSYVLPIGGFKELGITLSVINCDGYPSAKTCIGILKIPDYKSKEILREKLIFAMKNCHDFDFD